MKKLFLLLLLTSFIISCKKDVQIQIPFEVKTDSVSMIDWTSAVTGGDVLNDGGSIVTFRGVVWDTKPNPKANLETKTNDGRGIGSFKSKISGLIANTQYFVRAYAINSKDTLYGNEFTFKTSSWTPADIKNVFDWWQTGSGIVVSGISVSKWNGIKGNPFLPRNGYHMAHYSNSDINWNNKPSITLNPRLQTDDVGYLANSSKNKSDKTIILISRLEKILSDNSPLISIGLKWENPSFGIWGKSIGNYFCFDSGQPFRFYGDQFKEQRYQIIRISYDRTNGGVSYYVSNENNLKNKIYQNNSPKSNNYVLDHLNLGYSKAYGFTPKLSVVEVLAIDGIPSDDEINTYQKYLKYKYKL